MRFIEIGTKTAEHTAPNTLTAEEYLARYDKSVPRYTSYPTAAQFHSEISHDQLHGFIDHIGADDEVSIYIHIPFCHQLCHYCGCNTRIVNSQEPVDAYVESLCAEIALFARYLKTKPRVARIHFGGGSPNFPKVEALEKIFKTIKKYFTIRPHADIDMEADPRLLNRDKVATYAALGFTRMSLGVQDFDYDVQKAINRIQPYKQVAKAVKLTREHGIKHISLDLMTGLPKQTEETIMDTLDLAMTLDPDRLSIFPYAHVPWMKKHQKILEQYQRPTQNQRMQILSAVGTRLSHQYGMKQIGMDHFVKAGDALDIAMQKGHLTRNFQGYTDDPAQNLIGFGASAISGFEQGYTQNEPHVVDYSAAIAQGYLPMAKGYACTRDDRRRRNWINHILCHRIITLKDNHLFQDYKIPPASTILDLAASDDKRNMLLQMAKDGLIAFNDAKTKLSVTLQGEPFIRVVASCFDRYYEERVNRHAKAV